MIEARSEYYYLCGGQTTYSTLKFKRTLSLRFGIFSNYSFISITDRALKMSKSYDLLTSSENMTHLRIELKFASREFDVYMHRAI